MQEFSGGEAEKNNAYTSIYIRRLNCSAMRKLTDTHTDRTILYFQPLTREGITLKESIGIMIVWMEKEKERKPSLGNL